MSEFIQQELEHEAIKRTFNLRCNVIKKWMQAEEAEMKKNTVNIPEFMLPQEETFEYRFHSGITSAIKEKKFWELYDNALKFAGAY